MGKVARSKGTLFQSGTFSINCFKVCSPSDQSNLSQPESQKRWIPTLCDLEYGTLPPWVSFSLSMKTLDQYSLKSFLQKIFCNSSKEPVNFLLFQHLSLAFLQGKNLS